LLVTIKASGLTFSVRCWASIDISSPVDAAVDAEIADMAFLGAMLVTQIARGLS